MANYVYHYLQGSKKLANFLEENCLDLSVFPIDLEWKKSDDSHFFIQFSTRGIEYPLELIKEILLQFPETTWYAMEENCIRQAAFQLEAGEVTVTERKVTEAVNDNILALQLEDGEYRAQESLFLFESGRLVVEHFWENKSSEIQLNSIENENIQEHLEWLCKQMTSLSWGACVDTIAPDENQICCYIHFKHYDYTFENPIYEDDVADEEMSVHFTIFYQHLKYLLENKQIRNLL